MNLCVFALVQGCRQRLANEGGFTVVDNTLRINAIREQGHNVCDARLCLQMKLMKPLNEPPDAMKILTSFLPSIGELRKADSASG